jgi:molybdopterin/thiamine biosynthesis adenylyltransferase
MKILKKNKKMLTNQDKLRYARNLLLPNFGESSQQKLKQSKVLVIGTGGLGSAALYYLAAAGIGNIGIIDFDVVDISNLQRQILHSTNDLGRKKVDSASEKLKALNPEINIKTYDFFFDQEIILEDYDIVLDCTDNFTSKKFINQACVKLKKPLIHAGILEYSGQIMTIIPNETACYNCVFDEEPPVNPSKAVIGAVAGILGILQAAEAIKYLTGLGDLLTNKLFVYDFLKTDFRKIEIKKNKGCSVCDCKNK